MKQFEHLESRQLLAAGDLDPTFGNGGVIVDQALDNFFIHDSESLPDGKFILAGWANNTDGERDYLLRKFNANGTADTSFGGGDGIATGRFDPAIPVAIRDIVLMPDGKIIASCHDANDPDDAVDFRIARFNADGSLDTAFSGDGFFTVPSTSSFAAFSVQSDGKFLFSDTHFIKRFNADGTVDTAFGTGGTVQEVIEFAFTIEPLTDGSILLGGSNNNTGLTTHFVLIKLQANGSVDTSFGDNGRVDTTMVAVAGQLPGEFVFDIVPLAGGKFLASGAAHGSSAVARYNADGSLDTAFGDAGKVILPLGAASPSRTFLDDDGRIYLTAISSIGRLTPDGELDETFGRVSGSGGASFVTPLLTSTGALIVAGGRYDSAAQTEDLVIIRRLTEDDGEPSPITLSNRTVFAPGTDGDDFIHAQDTFGVDVKVNEFGRIFALEDVDVVSVTGEDGNDTLLISDIDHLRAHIKGGDGRDTIWGTDGKDTIEGNAHPDEIYGGLSADLITGNGGHDRIFGEGGNDHIYGRAGNDRITGNGGDDRIDGGEGTDILRGGGGHDHLIADDSNPESLFGGDGNDTADADDDDILDSIETT